MIFIKSFLYVPEENFSLELKHLLSFENPAYRYAVKNGDKLDGILPEYILYKKMRIHDKIYYRIPKFALGSLNSFEYKDGTNSVLADIPFKEKPLNRYGEPFEFNKSQKNTIDVTIELLKKEYGAFIVGQTGEGKSSIAVKIMSEMKQKTLILVHKNSLADQWIETVTDLTELTRDDIGSLRRGKFVDGKVVIGSMQSLMRLTIGREINDLFGLKIIDEAHRAPAEQFLKAYTRFNTKYSLALSATPNREDKLERIFFLHASEHIVKHKSVRKLTADYLVIDYNTKKAFIRGKPWTPYRIKLIENVIQDEERNQMLLDKIRECISVGRKILFVSERVAQLEVFYEKVKGDYPTLKVVQFWGNANPSKRVKLGADIVIGTTKKVSDGEDIPQLDTLISGTPHGSDIITVQLKGRIERAYEDKKVPLIIDIKDSNRKYTMFHGLFYKRIRKYKDEKMKEVFEIK